MNIGLLNLPVDNNYGGNLQRYALIKVLQDMGHDVEHIMLLRRFLPSTKKTIKSFIIQSLRKIRYNTPIYIWSDIKEHITYYRGIKVISTFYNNYIPHTKPVYSCSEIDYSKYNVMMVGSDQVWRKSMVPYFGLENFFFAFVPDKIRKIGYGICIGDYTEWNEVDKMLLIPLYKRFYGISVREKQSIAFLNNNGFLEPKAKWVLDPTLLLDRESYDIIISNSHTKQKTKGKVFAYILDLTRQAFNTVEEVTNNRNIDYHIQNLKSNSSIEQWIRNIKDSECVVTDSYHGVVFSIIYEKPFHIIYNERRGNVRIKSLLEMLDIDTKSNMCINYKNIHEKIKNHREFSLEFIKETLINS